MNLGLYIAMILDELAIPGLSYEILEGDTRIGGRVYTHYFPLPPKPDGVPDYKPNEKHQYYDVCCSFSSDLGILLVILIIKSGRRNAISRHQDHGKVSLGLRAD